MTTSAIDVSPFADDVHAVAAHYGVAEKDLVPAPTQGQVNLTVFLGNELVLRIPRNTRAAERLLLSGYRSALGVAASGDDLALERDALWYHLYLALARLLKEPSTSEERNWAAPRSATLLDILAFASSATPEPWPTLLRRISLS